MGVTLSSKINHLERLTHSKRAIDTERVPPGVANPKDECAERQAQGTNSSGRRSDKVDTKLNECWRVVDDPLQWILQHRKGRPRKKNSGWQGRSFCRTREALLRCVREYCVEVDPAALDKLNVLPDRHLDWDCTNLDVHGTAHVQPDAGREPLAAKALEVSDADE